MVAALLLLSSWLRPAWAAPAVPEGQDAGAWEAAWDHAGLGVVAESRVHIVASASGWTVTVIGHAGSVVAFRTSAPRSQAEREDLAAMIASLLTRPALPSAMEPVAAVPLPTAPAEPGDRSGSQLARAAAMVVRPGSARPARPARSVRTAPIAPTSEPAPLGSPPTIGPALTPTGSTSPSGPAPSGSTSTPWTTAPSEPTAAAMSSTAPREAPLSADTPPGPEGTPPSATAAAETSTTTARSTPSAPAAPPPAPIADTATVERPATSPARPWARVELGGVAWPGRTVTPRGSATVGLAWDAWTLGIEGGGLVPATIDDVGAGRTQASLDAGLRVGWQRPRSGPGVELGASWEWERFYEAGALVDAGSLPSVTAGARWRFPIDPWSVSIGATGAYTLADTTVHVGDTATVLSPWRVGILAGVGWAR